MSALEMIRFCPDCGHIGPIDNTRHISCCPDGNAAVDVPLRLINDLRIAQSAREDEMQEAECLRDIIREIYAVRGEDSTIANLCNRAHSQLRGYDSLSPSPVNAQLF